MYELVRVLADGSTVHVRFYASNVLAYAAADGLNQWFAGRADVRKFAARKAN